MSEANLKLDFNERADSKPAWLKSFQLNVDALWRYPERQSLELQIAADMGIETGSVLLTNGGDESIELLFKKCKLNNQAMLVPEPCFSQYTHNQKLWQNDTRFIAAQADLSIDVEALKSALRPKQWLILTRPNNPTGEYLETAVLVDLIQSAAVQNTQVFLDEAYVEFANESECFDYLAYNNLVTLRTFSKAFGLAGARIGYIFGHPALIDQFRQLAMPFNVSRANLQLATAAWAARDEIKAYCQSIARNRNQVTSLLQAAGLKPFPSRGNFVLFETNAQQKTLLAHVMTKADIQIKTELGGLPNAVRLTIPEKIEPLIAVLQQALKPDLLAFDMDGVLIDTSNSYDQCIMATVEQLTGVQITQQEIEAVRARGGFNNDWVLTAELIKNQQKKQPYEQVVATFQKYYQGDESQQGYYLQEDNLLDDSFRQILFGTDKPWRTAVVTGRPRNEAMQGVQQLNIKPDDIISADDIKQQKPDPEGLHNVIAKFQAQRPWFCGDTVDDMQAGTLAGCVCIGIAPTSEGKESLLQAGADVVLDDINQLKTLL